MTVDMVGARITRSPEPFMQRMRIQRKDVIHIGRSMMLSLVVALAWIPAVRA
jgi:hypothetical protein